MIINKKIKNRILCFFFPFLRDDIIVPYDSLIIDEFPLGWYKAFGLQMFIELSYNIIKYYGWKKYRTIKIHQIKEKFGQLAINGIYSYDKLEKVYNKYIEKSKHTCVVCGKPAKYVTTSWVCPYCEKHVYGNYIKIEDAYNNVDKE